MQPRARQLAAPGLVLADGHRGVVGNAHQVEQRPNQAVGVHELDPLTLGVARAHPAQQRAGGGKVHAQQRRARNNRRGGVAQIDIQPLQARMRLAAQARAAKPLSVEGKLSDSPLTDNSDHTEPEPERLPSGASIVVHSPLGSCQAGGDTS